MSKNSKPLTGLLSWERVEELIERIRSIGPWHIHSPAKGMETLFVASGNDAAIFLTERTEEIKSRKQGAGWIYVHTPDSPSWIKIYDPFKCGSSCSTTTPAAWWEMGLEDPREKLTAKPPTPEKKNIFDWIRKKKRWEATNNNNMSSFKNRLSYRQ